MAADTDSVGTTCVHVDSSAISEICYDQAGTVTITFVNGQQYQIAGMSRADLDAWLNAPSVGAYFVENIRGQYSRGRYLGAKRR